MSDSDPSAGGPPPVLQRVTRGPGVPGTAEGAVLTAAAALAAALPYHAPLTRDPPLRLLYLAAAGAATGRLDLHTDRGRFTLHLKRGVVEHAVSDAPEDALAAFLLARGAVGADALARAEGLRADHGGDLVTTLAASGDFNPATGYRLLQEHGGLVVTHALASDRGTCRWTPGAAAPASAFPLGPAWGVLCEATRRLDGLAVRTLLGDRLHRVAQPTRGRVELGQLRLTAQEARAASLFDGVVSPAVLAAARAGDGEVVLRTALLLADTELLAFGAMVPSPEVASTAAASVAVAAPVIPAAAGAPPAPPIAPASAAPPAVPLAPVPPPSVASRQSSPPAARATTPASPPSRPPVAPASTPAPPAAATPSVPPQDVTALEDFRARASGADHFTVLGLQRDATGPEVKAAYFDLARRFHPDAGAPGDPDRARELRADIFARVGEAYRALGDDAARASYREQLEGGAVGEVDVSSILRAEDIFRSATALVKGRQYGKALTALEQAIALNAAEPEFGVWLAWVRFLLSRDREVQYRRSTGAIEAALQQVPRCIPAYLFLAQMAKLMGDLSAAEHHLNRGLEIDPDNAELARERKFLRK